jgi:hypothetical protein
MICHTFCVQNHSLKVIRQDWFAMTSQKTSDHEHVERFLADMVEMSPDLIKPVVNMVDDNVSLT